MPDITSRDDIVRLVNAFYDRVRTDDTIGYFFNDVAGVDWDAHLAKMYDFWETVLLSIPSYRGNPMRTHILLDRKSDIDQRHFDHWMGLWTETVEELFAGPGAELAVQRAQSIRDLMQHKVERAREFAQAAVGAPVSREEGG